MDVTKPQALAIATSPRTGSPPCLKASQVISRIGDKWSVLVIMLLLERGHRFNELKRAIDGVSQRMLTLTVRNLERDGLVLRIVTPSIPPRVDYQLTALGRSLAEPVKALGDWAFAHIDAIGEAQSAFDATKDPM
ncbi:helix-turn-helix transcriptional regulator [Rhizobium leguminosarum]|nr:helix-turn-helix transcriptional regulator [Rhizobium leguminosarum]